jgi:hypothetical protein
VEFCGSDGEIGFCVNDSFSFIQLNHSLSRHLNLRILSQLTMTVWSDIHHYCAKVFLELTPLSSFLLRLPITIFGSWLGQVVLGMTILAL